MTTEKRKRIRWKSDYLFRAPFGYEFTEFCVEYDPYGSLDSNDFFKWLCFSVVSHFKTLLRANKFFLQRIFLVYLYRRHLGAWFQKPDELCVYHWSGMWLKRKQFRGKSGWTKRKFRFMVMRNNRSINLDTHRGRTETAVLCMDGMFIDSFCCSMHASFVQLQVVGPRIHATRMVFLDQETRTMVRRWYGGLVRNSGWKKRSVWAILSWTARAKEFW